jgi:hypothetical protein
MAYGYRAPVGFDAFDHQLQADRDHHVGGRRDLRELRV